MPAVLILPGIGNSGHEHWQSLWERENPSFIRVQERDWDKPVCDEWTANLERAVAESGKETVLVAHSLACLQVIHWAATTKREISGAMLVAVPDPNGPNFPADAGSFKNVPQQRLPFQSVVVASTNDPYASLEYASRCAKTWGSEFINIEDAGHINASSGLGEWKPGFEILSSRFLKS